MKVKEINRTANMAWSPAEQHPIYIATGTAAQQLDATFSTSAALEIFSLDLTKTGLEMEQAATLNTQHRFHKLVWGNHGMTKDTNPNGLIVGGTDNGAVYVYDAEKLLEGSEALVHKIENHTGAVRALDFNPFQGNLLASGASDSEIFIWDLNNAGTPMTPGAKSQPADEISCLSWNRQVQHILASTCPGGRCVVWDLRKNEPIIKVTDHSSRIRCKAVSWHPDVATQMVLASEDDHSPVIQVWDLRFATSPLKVLENHQRGVLSIAWCPQDPDLLLSCAKDNRILCWNPNSPQPGGEVVYELPTSAQWSFDVQWCPRNPGLISSSSFDGHISVYSLLGGGSNNVTQQRQVDKIASSFPGTDGFNQPAPQAQTEAPPVILKKPPRWIRRPVGASFGFGGKLISFASPKQPQQPQQQAAATPRSVHISQVITETELINRSNSLEEALSKGSFTEFCNSKIKQSQNDLDTQIWKFIKVNFEKEPRSHFVSLLGHDSHELARKAAVATGASMGLTNGSLDGDGVDAEDLAERMQRLSSGALEQEAKLGSGSKTPNEAYGDGDGDGAAAFDAITAAGPVEVENRGQSEEDSRSASPLTISRLDDTNGLVSQAILTGKFEIAVELCLHDNRMADAILLAIAGGPELLAKTQSKYFQKTKSDISRLISSIVTKDVAEIVQNIELENWKEALTALLTYSQPKEFSSLCDVLGERLEKEGQGKLAAQACLCYICSGSVDKLVSCWAKVNQAANSPMSLQDLVEKVVTLRKAIELKLGYSPEISSPILVDKLSEYAHLLASQGNLQTAVNYLGQSHEAKIVELRDRLNKAQGGSGVSQSPWRPVNVQAQPTQPTQPAQPASTLVSSRAHSAGYPATQQDYGQQRQQPAQQQTVNQDAYATTQAKTTATSQPSLRAKFGGPRQYPGYPQSGTQQYYSSPATSTTGQQQPGQTQQQWGQGQTTQNAQPTGNFYNPMEYTAQNPVAASQAAPTPGLGGYPSQPSQPTQPTPVVPVAYPTPPPQSPTTSQGVENKDGWNDPPLLKPKSQPTAYVPPQPITAPIAGMPAEQQQQAATPPYNMPQHSTGYQQQPPQQQKKYAQQQPQVQQQQTPQAPPPRQPEKPKAPIPAEHQVLCDTFDGLAQRCAASHSVNAQMKRKLDDVNRKLAVLYDKLREGMVSPMILQGLHEIAQAISAFNYQHGLGVHTRLVTSGNFSEISAFMPGLKVLMQLAQQLRV